MRVEPFVQHAERLVHRPLVGCQRADNRCRAVTVTIDCGSQRISPQRVADILDRRRINVGKVPSGGVHNQVEHFNRLRVLQLLPLDYAVKQRGTDPSSPSADGEIPTRRFLFAALRSKVCFSLYAYMVKEKAALNLAPFSKIQSKKPPLRRAGAFLGCIIRTGDPS